MKMRTTVKKYYDDLYINHCDAVIVKIYDDAVELDQTVAFPEGGGQEGDCGVIESVHDANVCVSFYDTQLSMAFPFFSAGADCKTGGVILHKSHDDLSKFKIGDQVIVKIDEKRRSDLTKSHSATHLMHCGIKMVRPDVIKNVIGCHIKCDSGRLDFSTEKRFTNEDISEIEKIANEMIENNYEVLMSCHPDAYDVRYWQCREFSMPCGGTHVKRTGEIPPIKIFRKNIGKNKERIYFSYD